MDGIFPSEEVCSLKTKKCGLVWCKYTHK